MVSINNRTEIPPQYEEVMADVSESEATEKTADVDRNPTRPRKGIE